MNVLVSLTYYSPHVSGLTLHVKRLAEGLAARGHSVTVLASRHDPALPRREVIANVRVVRVPVVTRLGKGPVMPLFLVDALPELRRAEVVVINLPTSPSEAITLPLVARLAPRRPLAAVYHCDLHLPPGAFNRLVGLAVLGCNMVASVLARRLIAYTSDYASASILLRRFSHKVEVVPPPVDIPLPRTDAVAALRRLHAPAGQTLLGMASRFASEKGIEYLLQALPSLRDRLGQVRIVFAGECKHVLGEERYWNRLQPLIRSAGDNWVPLGPLEPQQLADFFAACDVTLLPSVNMTESFGLVQVESMLCGTPVVATDLPGVRIPIRTTGMGIVIPPRSPESIVSAVAEIIGDRERYLRPRHEVHRQFSVEESVDRYEELLLRLRGPAAEPRARPT